MHMIRCLAAICTVLLSGCDAPSRYFRDEPVTRVEIGSMIFDVRTRGALSEAVRISNGWAPRLSGVAPFAEAAMEQVTGCDVTRLSGDQAVILGTLACGADGPRPAAPPALLGFECDPVEGWRSDGLDQATIAFDCVPAYR